MNSSYRLDRPLILWNSCNSPSTYASGKRVIFMWLPSHTGLAGIVSINAAAKSAVNLAESQTPVPFSDVCPLINAPIASHWQSLLKAAANNELCCIVSNLRWTFWKKYRLIIHRLRIGCTHFTHAFLLKKEDPPVCVGCPDPSDGRYGHHKLYRIPADMSQLLYIYKPLRDVQQCPITSNRHCIKEIGP
jgi:hypothetical protein